MKYLPILAAVLLSSCAAYVPEYNAAKIAKKSDREVLEYWEIRHSLHRSFPGKALQMPRDNARAEALKRGLVRPSAVQTIEAGKVAIGMTPNEALAAWGKPNRINSTTSIYRSSDQWVYGGQKGAYYQEPAYLYFERGRLTTIQN